MRKQIPAIQILLVLFLLDSICSAVNLKADINGNFFVDFNDFAILANDWRKNGSNLKGDITGDLQVDFKDVLELADAWLDCFVESSSSLVPANGAISVDPNGILRWSAGEGALSHNVYLGTGFNDVNNAGALSPEFKGNQTATNYGPLNLNVNTTYYWRIDEIGPRCTAKGNVWHFKTWLLRDPNLVGWWRFDEGSGAITYDYSARNNNGTVYGAVWTTGQINGALNFDGSDDYVEIPDNDNSLDMISQMTIAAWVKPNDCDNMYCIAGKQPSGTASEYISGNYTFLIAGGYLNLWHQTDTDGTEIFYGSTSSITAGVWQHIAVTLKEGDGVKFYINGELTETLPQTEVFGIVNNEPVRIGKMKSGDYIFKGALDDIRIYNKALSGTEIQQIYQQGSNP